MKGNVSKTKVGKDMTKPPKGLKPPPKLKVPKVMRRSGRGR